MKGLFPMSRFSETPGSQIHKGDFSGFAEVTPYLLVFVNDISIAW